LSMFLNFETKKRAWKLHDETRMSSSSWTHKHVKFYKPNKKVVNEFWSQNGVRMNHGLTWTYNIHLEPNLRKDTIILLIIYFVTPYEGYIKIIIFSKAFKWESQYW
jgi:hypothetical protein